MKVRHGKKGNKQCFKTYYRPEEEQKHIRYAKLLLFNINRSQITKTKNDKFLGNKWADDIKVISHEGKTKPRMALKYLKKFKFTLKKCKSKQKEKAIFFFLAI